MKIYKVVGNSEYSHLTYGEQLFTTLEKAKASVSEFFDGEEIQWYDDGHGFHWMNSHDELVTVAIWSVDVN